MAEKCHVCNKTVYFQERIKVDEFVFHTSCFKCAQCNSVLKLGNYAGLKQKYFCKPHFKQLFKLKGNYDEGFGEKQHKEKWTHSETNLSPEEVIALTGLRLPSGGKEINLSGLTMEDVENAQESFKKFDANHDGVIDKSEFLTLIKSVMQVRHPGKVFAEDVLIKLRDLHFNAADKDGSGVLDETEFLITYSSILLHDQATQSNTTK